MNRLPASSDCTELLLWDGLWSNTRCPASTTISRHCAGFRDGTARRSLCTPTSRRSGVGRA